MNDEIMETLNSRIKYFDQHFASCAKAKILRKCRNLELRTSAMNIDCTDELFCQVFKNLHDRLLEISNKHQVPISMMNKNSTIEFESWTTIDIDESIECVIKEMLEMFGQATTKYEPCLAVELNRF